jgi:hypothetical protein
VGELGAVHAGPVDPRGLSFEAPSGILNLTLLVRDAAGEIIDRELRSVSVPQHTGTTLAFSTPVVFRARNPIELRALTSEPSPPIHAGRDFERQDRMRVRVTLYGTESNGAVVTARLLGARGAALSDLSVQRGNTAGVYQVDVTASSISRGQFVLAIQATKDAERIEAMVPFRVR